MSEPRTCPCGHGREHPMVNADAEYGILGYIRLMIGGTPMPTRIRFRCRECNQVFDESTEPKVRAQHL